MLIEQIKIKGFRNYEDALINLQPKTLIIGSNDVGKSNLLYALRILLDKSLSEADLEPADSDFYAFNDIEQIEIIIKFINCVMQEKSAEECNEKYRSLPVFLFVFILAATEHLRP
ncbi:hypothetical protein G3A_14240 [Bacillus sp. 17376]|uniref:AAA family ATPase n=1 Tax=Mesobacillus boroniphilus TaxID=308892 RepID=UPI0003C79FD4|nr:AAA family ATPase [Mesobacillus boroniphilus]ESU31875.1 hypothetical protein G3A_14240 [Bacillus sp. 17376]